MLGAGLPLRCVALTAPGEYDTHSDQAARPRLGLQLTPDSLLAFQRDLEARGLADRVLVHVWSEFGRRAQENGDRGTDHGAAGVGFLIGSRVKGTMVGEFPGLETGLDADGNVIATADFRGGLRRVARAVVRDGCGRRDAGRVRRSRGPRSSSDRGSSLTSPARVQVVAQEYSYSLSRQKVKAGKVIIELVNHGQDAHDLDIERVGSTHIFRFPKVDPGHYVDKELKLKPGNYRLWCGIADHKERGMQATLRVVARKG